MEVNSTNKKEGYGITEHERERDESYKTKEDSDNAQED